MTRTYWQDAAADAAMQEEHGFVWSAMLETIDLDLAGKRVLDAGCNRGGFLRLLADRYAIAEGFGYDPASGAIDDARRLAAGRPLTFAVSATVPAGWDGFDAAFGRRSCTCCMTSRPMRARFSPPWPRAGPITP